MLEVELRLPVRDSEPEIDPVVEPKLELALGVIADELIGVADVLKEPPVMVEFMPPIPVMVELRGNVAVAKELMGVLTEPPNDDATEPVSETTEPVEERLAPVPVVDTEPPRPVDERSEDAGTPLEERSELLAPVAVDDRAPVLEMPEPEIDVELVSEPTNVKEMEDEFVTPVIVGIVLEDPVEDTIDPDPVDEPLDTMLDPRPVDMPVSLETRLEAVPVDRRLLEPEDETKAVLEEPAGSERLEDTVEDEGRPVGPTLDDETGSVPEVPVAEDDPKPELDSILLDERIPVDDRTLLDTVVPGSNAELGPVELDGPTGVLLDNIEPSVALEDDIPELETILLEAMPVDDSELLAAELEGEVEPAYNLRAPMMFGSENTLETALLKYPALPLTLTQTQPGVSSHWRTKSATHMSEVATFAQRGLPERSVP